MRKLKVDLHAHCDDDPLDRIAHSAEQLIDEAAKKEFDALSIANHRVITHSRRLALHAERRGVVLIPAIEKTIEGKHVLLVNVDWSVHPIDTFRELRAWKNSNSLIIAPHPYFPKGYCLRAELERNLDIFDAIEYSFFYGGVVDFNRRAERLAEKHGLPVVGSADCHELPDLGATYTLVESEKNAKAVVNAIREGKIEVKTKPLTVGRICAKGVRGLATSLMEATVQQIYGRVTGELVFQGKAPACRLSRE